MNSIATQAPIRLLFLSDHLGHANGAIHGATTYFLSVLPRLDRSAIDLSVCFLRERHPTAVQLEDAGIEPIFLNRGKWDPGAFGDLLKIVRQRDIQLIHAAGLKGCIIGRAVARMTGRQAIIHLHDMEPGGLHTRLIHRRMAKWAEVTLCVSDAVAEMARREFAVAEDRVVTLHNGIAIEQYANPPADARRRIRSEFQIAQDAPVIGMISRFAPVKQHELLIRAMPSLLARCSQAVLLTVGDGPTLEGCRAVARELGIEDSIRFTGLRKDVPEILAAVDVVAVPSQSEGLSYTALESTAAGRPVVAFNVGGMPEAIVEGQTGFLLEPDDIESFVDRLLCIVTDPHQAAMMGEHCRDHAQSFSIDRHVQRLMDIYKQLICSSSNQ